MTVTKIAVTILIATRLQAQTPADKAGFESQLRETMFTALALDIDAGRRGMDMCEQALKSNPNDAECLVWHGVGSLMLAGYYLVGEQNKEKGNPLLGQGIREMDAGVKLEPGNAAVRIPRGVILMQTTRGMDTNNFFYKGFLERARTDFQVAFDQQKDKLDSMGTHQVGELLQGLGDLYSRQGKMAEAEQYYRIIQEKLKGTLYADRASEWMRTRQPLGPSKTDCIGCHTRN